MSRKQVSVEVDGGWGWVVVVSGIAVYFIVFGTLRCQSVIFVHIVQEFESEFSAVAWVPSIATGGFSFAGVFAAPLIGKLGHRWTVMLGGLIAAAGTFLAAFAPSLLILNLTAGVVAGVGLGIAFVPTPVIIGHYFNKRRSLAINIASLGASVGSLAICPLNEVMVQAYTLRGYYMVFSGIILNICVAGSLMRPPPEPASQRVGDPASKISIGEPDDIVTDISASEKCRAVSTKELQATDGASKAQNCCQKCLSSALLRNRSYIIYCVSQVIFLAGFLCNQLYIVPYAVIEVGIPKIQASLLMSIGAFVEIGSRLIFGFLGDVEQIDRVWLFAGVLSVLSVCALLLPFMKTFGTLAAMVAITGLFQGGFSGMSVVILADVVGLSMYASGLGISTLLNGIGTLVTPPAVGRLVDVTGRPSSAIFVSAGILFLGAILSALIKVSMNFDEKEKKRAEEAEAQLPMSPQG